MAGASVLTVAGVFLVDLEDGSVLGPSTDAAFDPPPAPAATPFLPRLVATSGSGSTIVAIVDAKPPLLVSHDAGRTWRDSGRGLPPGHAVAVSSDDPDRMLYAARNRLYVSTDGGRFWRSLEAELPDIEAVAWAE
jgi:hypothetical protein